MLEVAKTVALLGALSLNRISSLTTEHRDV
jgi:hypothetical protein